MLVPAKGGKVHEGYRKTPLSGLEERLVSDCEAAISTGESVELSYPIRNVDRAIGATLSGAITARHGEAALPDGTIVVKLAGTAGQSFGAWLCSGVDLQLEGTANDYLGKGMGGGLISVSPRRPGSSLPHAAGNAVLYGATGGRAFIAGRVGQRFAVRNSGATAVIEGCSDHGGEYMTGGKVLVLGDVGRNFAAGMTGGIAYVWDPDLSLKAMLADTAPSARRPSDGDLAEIRRLVESHRDYTGSPVADAVLADWSRQQGSFWVISPSAPPHKVIEATVAEVPVTG
jgi:glutamate synthase domain-containing protein 3